MRKRLELDCVLVFELKGRGQVDGLLANDYVEGMAVMSAESDSVTNGAPELLNTLLKRRAL